MSTSYTNHISRLQFPINRVYAGGKIVGAATGAWMSSWIQTPTAGSAPSTAAVPTRATTGSYPFNTWGNATTNGQWFGGSDGLGYNCNAGGGTPLLPEMIVMFYDRLSHQGGLSGTVTTAQTTNFPTAALTRYTGGVGVLALIEVYTSIGSGQFRGSLSYTNQAGTSGRTGYFSGVVGTAQSSTFASFQAGDTGVKSVESLTLAASTGTAGNFGITLAKPLGYAILSQGRMAYMDPWMSGNFICDPATGVQDNACISMLTYANSSSAITLAGSVSFVPYD